MYKYFTGDWWADNLIMTEFLDEVNFYSGSERVKMYKPPKGEDGGSMLYGTTWKSYLSPTKNREFDEETGMSKTKVYSEYPELKKVFQEYSSIWFPYFEWTQIQMNKNFRTPPHKDSKNIGNSIIVGFGDYTGGNLIVEKEKDIEVKINLAPFKFNGSQFTHYTKDWVGTRYSLVFYNNFKKK